MPVFYYQFGVGVGGTSSSTTASSHAYGASFTYRRVQIPPPPPTWRRFFGLSEQPQKTDLEIVRKLYRKHAALWHPDRQGGSEEKMKVLNHFYDQAKRALVASAPSQSHGG